MLKSFLTLTLFCSIFLFANSSSENLHLATSSNPSRINPILATDSGSSQIADFIFSGLVKYDKTGKKIIGDLATKFYFEDNVTIVFELRQDVLWHDKKSFSAFDVEFTYNLLHSDTLSSPYTSSFRLVKSLEVINKYKIKVHYKKPYFKALEIWMMGILPKHLLKDETNLMGSKFNTNPIGTGPYRLSKLEFSKNIELSAFEDYFLHKPYIPKIIFHVISDPMTRFLMLKSNQLDIGSLEAMQYERQIEEKFKERFQILENISHSYTYLGFNLRLEKFKNRKVREALSLAINRQELVDILFLKHGEVCRGPFLPGSIGFDDKVRIPTQNLQRAKKLLEELGYSKENPFEFEIATSNSNAIRPYAAQIIQHQLSKIGVIVTLRVMEWQAFLNMVVFPRKFETVLLGWSLSLSPDPYLLWHSDSDKKGGFNFIGYQNSNVDSMIDKMQYITNREKLSKVQKNIFNSVVSDIPYLFLFIPNSITIVDKNIEPIESTINGIWHNHIEWKK